MLKRRLGTTDLECSVVAVGTWGIGGDFWGNVDDEKSISAIRAGLDAGINIIDTAPIYGKGHSEEIVGRAIRGLDRDQLIIATKVGCAFAGGKDLRPASIQKELEDSLRRLGTDYIDLYQVHWPDVNTPISESFTKLNEILQTGKVRYIGVSNFSIEQFEEASKYCPIVSMQPPYSLLQRDIEKDLLPYCVKNNLGVLTYGSIGAGALTGKFKTRPVATDEDKRANFYKFFSEENWDKTRRIAQTLEEIAAERGCPVVQVAINWVLKQKGVTIALVGVKTPEQAVMNAQAGTWSMTDEENQKILTAYEQIMGE